MPDAAEWYLVDAGKSVGPMLLSELTGRLGGTAWQNIMVYGPGLSAWTAAGQVPAIVLAMGAIPAAPPPPPPPPGFGSNAGPFGGSPFGGNSFGGNSYGGGGYGSTSDERFGFELVGQELQYIQIALEPGQMVIGEPGFLLYMTSGINMSTVLGDPARGQTQGFLGKLASAGARVLTGESAFVSTFSSVGPGTQSLAFAAHHPGKIVPFDLGEHGGQIIAQKDCFICAGRNVSIGIAFQKKIMTGLFGGEGFIMQRLRGTGKAMLAVGGVLVERNLAPGETLRIDTGCLVALESSVNYDVQFVGGIKNAIFGGDGIFFATVTGPGRVWIQSLPFSRLAASVLANYKPAATEAAGNPLINAGLGAIFGRGDS